MSGSHDEGEHSRRFLGVPFVIHREGSGRGRHFLLQERFIIGTLKTWQDNFPLRATDTESLSLSVGTRAVCKIRQEYLELSPWDNWEEL